MGAVLRATAVLPGIVRKYPGCHITWLTESVSAPLLENNPLIDQVVKFTFTDMFKLQGRNFDLVMVMDKDQRVCGILSMVKAKEVRGFQVNTDTGVIEPANPEARELYELGLSDQKKFFVNQKPETQLLFEALGLGEWSRDEYVLELSQEEKFQVKKKQEIWSNHGSRPVIGLNTGCSSTLPNKKLSIEGHRRLIQEIHKALPGVAIVLLGGPEDGIRNQQIAGGLEVIQSSTQLGTRDGLTSVAACDVIFTGDSLGLHMAIALKKWTVVWFGPTCAQEIDLYGRGEKVVTAAKCHPCWKRSCDQKIMCYDQLSNSEIVKALHKGLLCISSSSKQLSWETSYSAFLS